MNKKQKKWVSLLLILVLCLVYFAIGIAYGVVSSKKIYQCESAIVSTDDGSMYMVKNDQFQSEVLKFGESGEIKASYTELTNWPVYVKKAFFNGVLASDGESVYFLREYIDITTNCRVQYDIVKLMGETDGLFTTTIYTATGKDLPKPWSLSVENEKVFLTSVWSDNKTAQLESFEVTETGGLFLRSTDKFMTSKEEPIVKAMYLKGNVVLLTSSGRVYVESRATEKLIFPKVESRQNLVSSSTVNNAEVIFNDAIDNKIYAYNILTDTIKTTEISDFLYTGEYEADDIIYLNVHDERRSVALVTSTTYDKLEILFWNSGMSKKISSLKMPVGVAFDRCAKITWILYGATLLGFAIILFVRYLLQLRKQIVFRFIKIVTVFVGGTLIVFGVLEYNALYSQAYETRAKIARELSQQVEEKLSTSSVTNLGSTLSSYGDSYKEVLENSSLNNMQSSANENWEGICYYNQILLVNGAGSLLMGPSVYDEFLMPIENIYSKVDCELFYNSLHNVTTLSGTVENYCGVWVACAEPILDEMGQTIGVLATLVDTGALGFEITIAMVKYAVVALASLLVLVFLIYFFFRKTLKPLTELKTSFKEVAVGNYSTRLVGNFNDEFADINSTFNMMCEKISASIYSLKTIKNNYNKFVPESVFKMFDETNIGKINVGDVVESKCVFVMQSISGLSGDKKDGYKRGAKAVEFTNKMFSIVSECAKANNGVIVSNEFGLGILRVLFGENGNEAVDYSLNVEGAVWLELGDLPKLETATLIHKDKTIFGISGDADSAFPVVSSDGAEDLAEILLKLKNAGIKVVVTDSIIDDVGQEHSTRYLGFVSSKGSQRYRLFEVLDACSATEKSKKMQTRRTFERGVELFYTNNFYMARSEFSKVLQECPEDEVSRWYLLVCDRCYKDPEYKASYELLRESMR